MSVTVTLNFATAALAAAALALIDQAPAPAAAPTKEKSPLKSAEAAKPAATQSSAGTVPTPAASETAPTPPAGDAAVPYEKSGVPERIQKLVAKDRAAAVALLGEFGVKKGGELKPDQFAAFAARCDAALADSLT